MKYLYVYFAAMAMTLSINAHGQNMVPNGDFEAYTTCPTLRTQITRATGWTEYCTSPDYLNTCASASSGVGIPLNVFGYQHAANGNGYAGLGTSLLVGNDREAITRSITPLIPGITYEVSMSVSLSNTSAYGINALGALFYHNGPKAVSRLQIAATTPQVSYAGYGPITDTSGWVRVMAFFTADSAYDNIAIAGFGPVSSFTIDTLSFNPGFYSYYYIDSVVVRTADKIYAQIKDTAFCAGDTISIPFIINGNVFTAGNVFTLQMSGATGSFASPTTLATITGATSNTFKAVIPSGITPGNQYRVRITASNPPDTSNDIIVRILPSLPASVSITSIPNGPVAGGDLITFNATPVNGGNYPKYQWKRNNKDVIGALSNTWGATTLNNKDIVCVEMSSSYLCPQPKTAKSNCITVSINTTGIDNNKLMQGVSIYPNPVHDELMIEGICKGTRIQLFDVLGRLVINTASSGAKETINTSSLSKGTYLLQLMNIDGNRMNAKVTKE